MGGERLHGWVERLKPAAVMVLVQTVLAGMNIFYKLAVNDGMYMTILVAYRYLFATACLLPVAYIVERNKRPRLTRRTLILGFFAGLFGGPVSQTFYIASIKLTSAAFAAAMLNLVPAITFMLVVILRMEKLVIQKASGQAKVIGTLVGIGGAMILTFYKGPEVNIWSTHINVLEVHDGGGQGTQDHTNYATGSVMALTSCLAYALWLIVQAEMSKAYPCHYSCTALMCFMSSVQCVVLALCLNHDPKQWRLGFDIRLLSVAYCGIIASALNLTLLSWCIKMKGPLYASAFNPLTLVVVATIASFILAEMLHVGSIIGAVFIVIGLYFVLWGKSKEAPKTVELTMFKPQADISVEESLGRQKENVEGETKQVLSMEGVEKSINISGIVIH